MKLDEWCALEIDGFKGAEVVGVPLLAAEAALVAAAADRMGLQRSTLLHVVVGVGLAMVEKFGPPTPVSPFAGPPPAIEPAPADEEAQP